MKKEFILLTLLSIPFMLCAQSNNCYDVEIGGIYYKLNPSSKEATVVMGTTWNTTNYDSNELAPIKVASYSGDIVIPESINHNGETYVVTSIGGYEIRMGLEGGINSWGAFESCAELKSITIPQTITYIGNRAFEGCSSLDAVYISDLVSWCNIGFDIVATKYYSYAPSTNPLACAHNLYLDGSLISDLVIPEQITTILPGAFIGGNFKSVTFHKETSAIHGAAFEGCNNLANVYTYSPALNLYSIMTSDNGTVLKTLVHPFSNVNSLILHYRERYKDFYINDSPSDYDANLRTGPYIVNGKWPQFGKFEYIEGLDYNMTYIVDGEVYKKEIKEVGESVTPEKEPTKEGYTFSGWSDIPETMPSKDVTVNGSFLINKYKLSYVVDGEEYKMQDVEYNLEITPEPNPTKKGMTFSGWSEIPEKMPAKDVTITGTFIWSKETKDGVIYQVYNAENELASVIDNDKASGDVKIVSSVEIDEYKYTVTDIVDFSFKNNTEITSVVIPESVMKIGDEAFYGCKNLTKIELGKSVNQIEPRAFAGIDKLTDVTCYVEDLVPDADRTAFENSYIEDYVTLHVPAGSIEKYKAVAPWKNFKEIVAIEEEEKDVEGETITLKDSGKGTWCSENDLDFTDLEDIKAYIASGYDDIKKTIWLTRVYSVPAGTGIMVKGTPGEHKIPYAKVRAYYANMFKGVVGTAEKIESTDGDWTNYYMAGGQFKIVNGSTTINPNRCYLQLPTLVFAGTRSVDVVYEDEIDDKTGINPSFVTNDQEPAVIYNLQGQRVENPRKGVYIRNGKKIIIK